MPKYLKFFQYDHTSERSDQIWIGWFLETLATESMKIDAFIFGLNLGWVEVFFAPGFPGSSILQPAK